MILVEVPPGAQRLFSTFEELAAAIRRGELGPEARIYHRASAQWLSITVHPEFRRLSGATPDAATPSSPSGWRDRISRAIGRLRGRQSVEESTPPSTPTGQS
jgi:hypothetical protein